MRDVKRETVASRTPETQQNGCRIRLTKRRSRTGNPQESTACIRSERRRHRPETRSWGLVSTTRSEPARSLVPREARRREEGALDETLIGGVPPAGPGSEPAPVAWSTRDPTNAFPDDAGVSPSGCKLCLLWVPGALTCAWLDVSGSRFAGVSGVLDATVSLLTSRILD